MSGETNGGRTRAYQALRESEELHRATLSSISDAVFLADDDGAFTFICPNVDVIFGYAPDEVQAMGRIAQLLGDDLYDRSDLAARGEIRNVERDVTSKTGERRTVLVHLKRVSIQGATVLYTCRDITERKHAEKELAAARLELAHAGRLALVGELTASIVHEIQQPLAAILANASAGMRLTKNGAGDPERDGTARDVQRHPPREQRRRADHRTAADPGAQASARASAAAPERRDGRRTAARRGRCAPPPSRDPCRPVPGLPMIAADRVSLQQVILNLIVNAMDAMDPDGGDERRVVVRTRPRRHRRRARRERYRSWHRTRRSAEAVRRLLHHEAGRSRSRPGDRALDRRGSFRADLGGGRRRTRRNVSSDACPSGPIRAAETGAVVAAQRRVAGFATTPTRSAKCTSSATERAPIFRITRARCTLMVFSAVPRSAAICLLSLPGHDMSQHFALARRECRKTQLQRAFERPGESCSLVDAATLRSRPRSAGRPRPASSARSRLLPSSPARSSECRRWR